MKKEKLFTIILPTYKREKELTFAVESILNQTSNNWRVIIVNDSPDHNYAEFEKKYLPNEKIIYLKQIKNLGKNAGLNRVLDLISLEKKPETREYITFLDDDDWFNERAIENMNIITEKYPEQNWFISNRAMRDGKVITKFINDTRKNNNEKLLSYAKKYWIFKKMIGDATVLLDANMATKSRFSKKIKNGEEWFYFSILTQKKFMYYDFNSTISNGYLMDGITKNYNNKKLRLKNTLKMFFELIKIKKINFWHILYFPLRIGSILIKSSKAQIRFVEKITSTEKD